MVNELPVNIHIHNTHNTNILQNSNDNNSNSLNNNKLKTPVKIIKNEKNYYKKKFTFGDPNQSFENDSFHKKTNSSNKQKSNKHDNSNNSNNSNNSSNFYANINQNNQNLQNKSAFKNTDNVLKNFDNYINNKERNLTPNITRTKNNKEQLVNFSSNTNIKVNTEIYEEIKKDFMELKQ